MAKNHRDGRPPKYSDPEEMQAVIDRYFEECKEKLKVDSEGNLIFDRFGRPIVYRDRVPTVSGLARALGLKSRQSLLDYQAKRKFEGIIQDAKLRVETYCEEQLYTREGCNGARFTLWNNFGWKPDAENEKTAAGVQIINEIPKQI